MINVGILGVQWVGSLSGAINELTGYVPIFFASIGVLIKPPRWSTSYISYISCDIATILSGICSEYPWISESEVGTYGIWYLSHSYRTSLPCLGAEHACIQFDILLVARTCNVSHTWDDCPSPVDPASFHIFFLVKNPLILAHCLNKPAVFLGCFWDVTLPISDRK